MWKNTSIENNFEKCFLLYWSVTNQRFANSRIFLIDSNTERAGTLSNECYSLFLRMNVCAHSFQMCFPKDFAFGSNHYMTGAVSNIWFEAYRITLIFVSTSWTNVHYSNHRGTEHMINLWFTMYLIYHVWHFAKDFNFRGFFIWENFIFSKNQIENRYVMWI